MQLRSVGAQPRWLGQTRAYIRRAATIPLFLKNLKSRRCGYSYTEAPDPFYGTPHRQNRIVEPTGRLQVGKYIAYIDTIHLIFPD